MKETELNILICILSTILDSSLEFLEESILLHWRICSLSARFIYQDQLCIIIQQLTVYYINPCDRILSQKSLKRNKPEKAK